MKEIFSLFLLIVAVAFFSQKLVFQKRIGFVSLSGLEIYIIGILFSFFISKKLLYSLASVLFMVLAFIGFSFGAQFKRGVVKKIKFKEILYGFLISLQYFAMFLVLKHFYSFRIAAIASAVFSIPAPLLLSNLKNEKLVISGELSIVFVLVYYSCTFYGYFSVVLAILFGLLGVLFVIFEKILKKPEIFILLFGFLLLISGSAQVFNFSAVLSLTVFGFVAAFFSPAYAKEIKQSLDQPLFLSLLFFAGIFFSPSFFVFIPLILVLFLKPFLLIPFLKKKASIFIPFGALSIAVAVESMSFGIITFVTILYFILLGSFEFFREKLKWDI